MFADTCLSEEPADGLHRVRVRGGISIAVEARGTGSHVESLCERDGYKIRMVRRACPPEAIIVNTGGGLAGGDQVLQSVKVRDGARLTVTTQASERCYRSRQGENAIIDVEATVGPDSTLNWLPQETILFDRARLSRTIDVSLAQSARLLLAETVVFGRTAMGETLVEGLFSDRWRIRRGGGLVFAENTRLTGDTHRIMTAPAMAGPSKAAMTLLLASPDAEDWLNTARSVLRDRPFECAASAWDAKLVVRALAEKPEHLRHLMKRLVPALGGPSLPRSWWT